MNNLLLKILILTILLCTLKSTSITEDIETKT